jgi:membrane fusion protein (multidrug efflux system)
MRRPVTLLRSNKHAARAALAALTLLLAACGSAGKDPAGAGGRGGPINVGFVVVNTTAVPLMTQLGGRVVAFETSEVRPQVNGLIRERYFQEGSVVRKGQPLYRIDPSLYQASVSQAEANLASARASAEAARVKADRYRPLAQMEAISKQDYTDAAAQARQAQASVAQTSAALRTAQINLHYTSIPAPISGRFGR